MLRLQDLQFRRLDGEEGRPIGGTSYANVIDIAAGRSIVIHFYRMFAREIGFKNVYNGFFDRMEIFPNYPQLGCSGFVIGDPSGKIVEPRTPAFLQYRQAAFAWMVGRLHALPGSPNVIHVRIRSQGPRGTHLVKAILLRMDTGKKEAEVLVNGMVTKVPVGLIEDDDDEEEEEDEEGGGVEQKQQAPETETPPVEPPSLPGALNEQELEGLLDYSSVGVHSMDRGHDACAAALRELATTRRIPAMHALQAELKEHFEEEEALFVRHKFGGPNGEATAHRADHERILGLIASALDQAGSGGAGPNGDVLFSSSFIRYLASRLRDHINDFDALYTNVITEDGEHSD